MNEQSRHRRKEPHLSEAVTGLERSRVNGKGARVGSLAYNMMYTTVSRTAEHDRCLADGGGIGRANEKTPAALIFVRIFPEQNESYGLSYILRRGSYDLPAIEKKPVF